MNDLRMKTKFESCFPFWLNPGPHSSSKTSKRPPRNVAAFLAATGRLPVYEQDQLIKVKALGFGTSFQAEACKDTKSGNLVVVKKLRTKQSSAGLHDGAVLQELKVSVYPPFLKHGNVVRTLGFLENENSTGIGLSVSLVLEYADHGSLAQYLSNASRSISQEAWRQQQSFIMDICSGLEILHRCQVIHGDVKPDNVLLFSSHSSTRCPLVAKLADFGSSVVEDTMYEDIDNGDSASIYRGTPVYTPGYLRKYSGRVPFHLMPVVEIYSFGLLLWSICTGEPYYLRLPDPGKRDLVDYLDSLGTDGFRQRFRLDLEDISNSSDHMHPSTLLEVFNFCMRDVEIDHSPILPIDREKIYREAFSAIIEVRKILIPQTEENRYSALKSPLLASNSPRENSIEGKDQTYLWQPFHLGSIPSKENVDQIPWYLQCELVQQLLDRLNDSRESEYQRGKAALQLSSYFAIGLGCKKDYEKVLYNIRLSATFGDNVAQLICPRIFRAHGKLIDRLDLEDIPCSDPNTEFGTFEGSDADMEDLNEHMNYDEHAYGTVSGETFNDPMDDTGSLEDNLELTSSSDMDLRYTMFILSATFDRDFDSKPNTEPTDYFWMKVRMFERAMGFASQATTLRYRGDWYAGLDDPKLVTALHHTAILPSEAPEVEVKCEDGTLIHIPALHHVVSCGMFKLGIQLIDQEWSINAVNDDGDTLLHLAMRHGDSQMTEYLIRKGVNVAANNFKGVTPLHYLSMFGNQSYYLKDDDDESKAQTEKLHEGQVVAFSGPGVWAIAKMLVDAGANVNDFMGQFDSTIDVFFSHRISGTPLHAAVTVGNKSAVETLLRLGADANIRPFHDSYTALELAAQLHLADVAEMLLKYGASLRTASEAGTLTGTWAMHHVGSHVQPLSRWLLHGSRYKAAVEDTIRVFMAAAEKDNWSLDEPDAAGLSAFTCALQESGEDTYIVEAFLDCYATLPPAALSSAVLSCGSDEANASKVELVLQRIAASETLIPEEDDNKYRDQSLYALRLAVSTGALAAAKEIINYFGSESLLHAQDEEGLTLLHDAVISGDINVTKYLLCKNSPINHRDRNGRTALGIAVTLGNEALASILMFPEADVNLRAGEHEGGTILHLAASRGSRQCSMLGFLLSAYIEESCKNGLRFPRLHIQSILDTVNASHGDTALHLAAYCGDYAGVFALLAAGATVSIRNSADSTPLDVVKRRIKLHDSVKEQPAHLELVAGLKKCATHLERAKT